MFFVHPLECQLWIPAESFVRLLSFREFLLEFPLCLGPPLRGRVEWNSAAPARRAHESGLDLLLLLLLLLWRHLVRRSPTTPALTAGFWFMRLTI